MKIRYKDRLWWLNIITIPLLFTMYITSIFTLEKWAWGFWSYELLVTCAFAAILLLVNAFVDINRKLDKCVETVKGEEE